MQQKSHHWEISASDRMPIGNAGTREANEEIARNRPIARIGNQIRDH